MSNEQEVLEEEPTIIEIWTPGDILYYGPTKRTIPFIGEINQESSLPFISQLLELEAREPGVPITVHLNTEGGSLTDAFATYDAMRSITSPLIVITTGICASAGLLLLSAGDARFATENTLFFYHQPILPLEGLMSREQVDQTKLSYYRVQDSYDETLMKRCKIKKSVWKKEFTGRIAKNFNAQEALEYGFIRGVISGAKKRRLGYTNGE
tara:strand:+ start:322 stop:951 length:630 start_codon:yes stop_codon:yes gene_type:complete